MPLSASHPAATIVAGAVAFVTAVVVTALLKGSRHAPVDHPNERSLHSTPVPRSGGVGIMAGLLIALAIPGTNLFAAALALALAAVSYLDDHVSLHPALRLLAHLATAVAFLWSAGLTEAPLMMIVLALAIGWLTNLYNFMDGSDGLAGGMAVIGFGAYGVAAAIGGALPIAALALCVAAAAAGFLVFNFPPAKIFMGDVGSIPLGFLAGAIGVLGWREGAWPLWFGIVVFAPFVVDASVTLVRRILRGERVWQAHRNHYYQRLILSGWTHRRTALTEYALMLACAVIAIVAMRAPITGRIVLLGGLAAAFIACMFGIDLRWRRFRATRGG